MSLWRIKRGKDATDIVLLVRVHTVWDILEPLALEVLTADVVVADPERRELRMIGSFLLAQFHVQAADVFGYILVVVILANSSVAEGFRPLSVREVLDQQSRAVAVVPISQPDVNSGVI